MKTFTITLHHLGFYWPAEQAEYGRSTILVKAPEESLGDIIAEIAFDDTNNPTKTATYVERIGKCYTLSVGDVAEIKEKKEFYLCMGSGWMKISRAELTYLGYKVEYAAENGKHYQAGYQGPKDLARRRAANHPLAQV